MSHKNLLSVSSKVMAINCQLSRVRATRPPSTARYIDDLQELSRSVRQLRETAIRMNFHKRRK